MDRSTIKDAGVIAVFNRILSKPVAELDAGEKNFIQEWREYFLPEELKCFENEVSPEVEAVEIGEGLPSSTQVEMTLDEIRARLTELGVPFSPKARSATLKKLLEEQTTV